MPMRDQENLKEKRLIFYEQDIDRINKVLEEFNKLSESKAQILIDKEGHMVTKFGTTENFDMQTVAALVAGSFAATKEMARLLGEDEFSVLFHQGKKDNIQLTLISDRTILATVFDERTTIGMVRLYAKEAAEKLSKLFDEIQKRDNSGAAEKMTEYTKQAQNKLDDFFDGK
jgi:predicted regulator of Ras-like GTPase activity (Roadblock/LC7/MglB family)